MWVYHVVSILHSPIVPRVPLITLVLTIHSYICRADIGKEGYKHFCQHFRQVPGTTCADCDKCDLYVQEDEEAAIREAAMKAEEEYFKSHDVPATWKYNKDKIGPVKLNNSLGALNMLYPHD